MNTLQEYEIKRNIVNTIGNSKYGQHFILQDNYALMCMAVQSGEVQYLIRSEFIALIASSLKVWEQVKKNLILELNCCESGIKYSTGKPLYAGRNGTSYLELVVEYQQKS